MSARDCGSRPRLRHRRHRRHWPLQQIFPDGRPFKIGRASFLRMMSHRWIPAFCSPPAAPILAKINLPVSNPSGSAPIRGETSMPEVQRVNPVTVSNKTPTQSPTTSSGSKTPTPSNSGSPNLLTAIFNSLSNTKQSATPTSSGLAATLSASSGVARSLSNLGGNQASQSHSSSTSNAGSRGNSSGGGGFGFGGNRRG